MSRCERFRKAFEDEIVTKFSTQVGDLLEVLKVGVGMTEDSNEVVKLYVLTRNRRTGAEDEMTFDYCLFEPDDYDAANVERLHDMLFREQEAKASRKKVIEMLKKAELIADWYKEPT